MIKVVAGVAVRSPVPASLRGLHPDSLLDLSWTDPALGLQDAAWWPEVSGLPELSEFERYGEEVLTVDEVNRRVVVSRSIVPWTESEIAEHQAVEARKSRELTKVQFLDRFTIDEQGGVYRAAKVDALVEVFLDKLRMAEEVFLDDPNLLAGVQVLVDLELITDERRLEILS